MSIAIYFLGRTPLGMQKISRTVEIQQYYCNRILEVHALIVISMSVLYIYIAKHEWIEVKQQGSNIT
jgi:hypothetical protein